MRIALITVAGVQMLDVAGPMGVFFEANEQVGHPNADSVQIVALKPRMVTTLNGTRFAPDASIATASGDFDTLLIARSQGIREYEKNPELVQWIVAQSRRVWRFRAEPRRHGPDDDGSRGYGRRTHAARGRLL